MQSLDEKVFVALRKIMRALDLHSKQLSKKYGLTTPQLMVLKAIYELKTPSLKGIATRVDLSSATVSDVLDRLITKGLVTRSRSGGDKRQTELKLTELGREVHQKVPSVLQETFVKKFSRLEDWEQNLTLSSVQRIAAMMSEIAIEREEYDQKDVFPVFSSEQKEN